MATITESIHYGEHRSTRTIEVAGYYASAVDLAALLRMGGFNATAADDTVRMTRLAQTLNTYEKAELGWARYTFQR